MFRNRPTESWGRTSSSLPRLERIGDRRGSCQTSHGADNNGARNVIRRAACRVLNSLQRLVFNALNPTHPASSRHSANSSRMPRGRRQTPFSFRGPPEGAANTAMPPEEDEEDEGNPANFREATAGTDRAQPPPDYDDSDALSVEISLFTVESGVCVYPSTSLEGTFGVGLCERPCHERLPPDELTRRLINVRW